MFQPIDAGLLQLPVEPQVVGLFRLLAVARYNASALCLSPGNQALQWQHVGPKSEAFLRSASISRKWAYPVLGCDEGMAGLKVKMHAKAS